ncbi:MAG TPA: glycosyltransferase family 2 protein [Polyangiaceae bacterium]|nr:glycosyltransferase family 2 protein [Polyangiaceae bacterium]
MNPQQAPAVSLVLPVYNEEPVLPELFRRLGLLLAELDPNGKWEVVFVNDGSSDRSRQLLEEGCTREPRFKLVQLSRNFGHQIAITAGLDRAEGDAVVIMDADLQDPPEVIADMLARFAEGYDVVYAVRRHRAGEGWFKRASAALFYRALKRVVGVDIPTDTGDFRLMSRRAVLALRGLREANRFVRGPVAWIGFRQTAVYYDRSARYAGATHYPLRKMLRFASDGIVSFSTLPLRVATLLGIAAGVAAAGVALWVLYVVIWHVKAVPGWATLMFAVSLAASAQLLMIGILGEYLGRIYDEVKRRPLYLVDSTQNFSTEAGRVPAPPHTSAGDPVRQSLSPERATTEPRLEWPQPGQSTREK